MSENKKDNKITISDYAIPTVILGGMSSAFGSYMTIGGVSVSSILAGVSGFFTLPVIAVGTVGVTSLYGIYNILTKSSKEFKLERDRWINFFENTNLSVGTGENKYYPILFDKIDYEYGSLYKFDIPIGFSSHMISGKDIAIKEFLGARSLDFFIKDGILFIQSITSELPTFKPFTINEKNNTDLKVEVGVNIKNEVVSINLDKNPSLLIAGQTGSGKSVCTNAILTQIYCDHKDVDVYLVDLKRAELGLFKNCKNTVKYTKDLNEAKDIIRELKDECDRRSDLFSEVGAKKMSDYNARVSDDKKLRKIVLAIDETVRLMNDKEAKNLLAELGFICRSASITVISNIQRPTANLFSADFKASLTNIIGFKTVNGINSRVICDDEKLKNLRGKGHGVLFSESCNDGEEEFQGYALEDWQIERFLKEYNCF